MYCEANFTHAARASSVYLSLWCSCRTDGTNEANRELHLALRLASSYFFARPFKIVSVSSFVGSGTFTGWKPTACRDATHPPNGTRALMCPAK